MQPLGRRPCRFPSKTDCHPPKGYVNWWEAEMGNDENKPAERQAARREIAREIDLMQTED